MCGRLVRDGRGCLEQVPDASGEVALEATNGVLGAFALGALARARDADGKRVGVVKYPKSNYGRRDIPLTPDLARRLWRLQRAPGELLFTSPNGGRMNYHNTWNRALRPALDAAGVEWPAGFHTFRHTCASRLFAAGRNIKQIQRWLGHHKASFTLDTYTHLIDGDLGDAFSLPVLGGGNTGATGHAETVRNDAAEENDRNRRFAGNRLQAPKRRETVGRNHNPRVGVRASSGITESPADRGAFFVLGGRCAFRQQQYT